jgi:predicted extracellular nuclease
MKLLKLVLLISVAILSFTISEANGQQKNKLIIGFYNVENLFDTIRDPQINDEDFTPNGKYQWTSLRYQQKLMRMSEVIRQLGSNDGPDILGLCEVENKQVLEDLCKTSRLNSFRYKIVHHNSPDERGIDVALIYKSDKATLLSQKSIHVQLSNPTDKTRDILLASLAIIGGDTIHAFVCHLPSRRGGQDASNGERVLAAMAGRKVIDSLLAKNKMAKIIVMGDMNDEPNNQSMRKGLMALSATDSAKNGHLYNAMASLALQGNGSYMHNKKWNMLDQMLLSEGLVSGKKGFIYEPVSATIFKPDWLQETNEKYKGSPWRTYAGNKYLGGYSDHFAVFTSYTFEGTVAKSKRNKTPKNK